MKKAIFILIICISFSNCSREKKNNSNIASREENITSLKIQDTLVDINSLVYHRESSVWKTNNKIYSGYVVTTFENDSLKRKFGILNGKKQNADITWFQNGKIKSKANYHKGKLHGKKQVWSQDSLYTLIAEYNYHLGKVHGKQTKWYSTGELFQITNLQMGKEEGIQQAYRKNGALYANYEAKNGRIFGLKKASLCFGLKDQKITDND
jgi:antitoxin component YwqK of YwqJK toxin-antitoxin module